MSPAPTAPTEPRLPQELEHIIFELAARDDRDRTLPVLLQVARRVRDWSESLVYDTIVLEYPDLYKASKSRLHHPPRFPLGPQALYVRHLFIASDVSDPAWPNLLPRCHNLEDLKTWTLAEPDMLSLLTSAIQSPLRTVSSHGLLRLSAVLQGLFPGGQIDFNHEVFKHLTYLEVLDYRKQPCDPWVEGNNYGCIPNLRYLAIANLFLNTVPSMGILKKYLDDCKSLEVLIFPGNCAPGVVEHMEELLKTTRWIVGRDGTVQEMPEDRVVLYDEKILSDSMEWACAWYKSAVSGNSNPAFGYDFWLRSEKVVQRRRWKRDLEKILWDSMLDSDTDINLGEWMATLDMC